VIEGSPAKAALGPVLVVAVFFWKDRDETLEIQGFSANRPADRYTTGTGSASLRRQRGEDVNGKRAAAAAAGVLGALILVVALVASLGVGYLAGHSSARTGASTVSHSSTRGGTAHSAPVKATLDAMVIYGDSTSVPAIYGDGNGVSSGTTGSTSNTSTNGNTITVTPTAGTALAAPGIYGD
jgi:hypothetical protein